MEVSDCNKISDDDPDNSLLKEVESCITDAPSVWTADATRALIHVRGPMEKSFNTGRKRRSALWLYCARQMEKLGFRFSAAKVQKKWHNIIITYNNNINKNHIQWEFFEEMYKYLQGKRACYEVQQYRQKSKQKRYHHRQKEYQRHKRDSESDENMIADLLLPNSEISTKSNDEVNDDITIMPELKPTTEYNNGDFDQITSNSNDSDFMFNKHGQSASMTAWWQDYCERKLQLEREKLEQQKDMHREYMQFNKVTQAQQENVDFMKIDAINSLTSILQELVDTRSKKI